LSIPPREIFEKLSAGGVRLVRAPSDWQVLQQGARGQATLELNGTWAIPVMDGVDYGAPRVMVRLVHEISYAPVDGLDWTAARMRDGGAWSIRLKVPAGGPYRVETELWVDGRHETWPDPARMNVRGDTIHHLAVGDLWVIAGQSNASGSGRGPVEDPTDPAIRMFGQDGRWRMATHPLHDPRASDHPYGEWISPGHSPFLAFARRLHESLGYPIGLIPTALGGSPLIQWNPIEDPEAPLYHNMLRRIGLAGGRIAGIVWDQGASDASTDEWAANYASRFADFLTRLRADLRNPELPIITAQVGKTFGTDSQEIRRWVIVREQQRIAAAALSRVGLISTLDVPMTDAVHVSPAGNMMVAGRFSDSALAVAYGLGFGNAYPDVSAVTAESVSCVAVTFANVRRQLATVSPIASQFVAEDSEGMVKATAGRIVDERTVEVTFERALKDGAVLHGNFDTTIPQPIHDLADYRPMLAFTGFPIKGLPTGNGRQVRSQ
jgi:hypothetical protein